MDPDDGVSTYSYHGRNLLSWLVNALAERTTWVYDALGRVTTMTHANATTAEHAYDADLERRQAEDSSGLAKFIHDLENVLIETDSGGTTQVAYTLEPQTYGNLISQRRAAGAAWHHSDGLGSTERLTDSNQAGLATYLNTAFGVPRVATGTHPNRLRFGGRLGYRWEPDATHYDVRRRRLNAARGGWLSKDPAQQSRSWFVYARANPANNLDPTGRDSLDGSRRLLGAPNAMHPGTPRGTRACGPAGNRLGEPAGEPAGTTGCNLLTGQPEITINDYTCTAPCTLEHELVHAAIMREACSRAHKCIYDIAKDEDYKNDCYNRWLTWHNDVKRYTECFAYTLGLACDVLLQASSCFIAGFCDCCRLATYAVYRDFVAIGMYCPPGDLPELPYREDGSLIKRSQPGP